MTRLEKIILILANKILAKYGGSAEVENIHLVRMSKEFKEWVYPKGYKIFKKEQENQRKLM